MKKVLVFGTFDGVHPGHQNLLEQASQYGNELHVVVALDKTVEQVKKKRPANSEAERREMVEKQPWVTKAYLGNPDDKYQIIETIAPDVIALGYDQEAFTKELAEELKARGLEEIKVVRLKPYHPEIYKSSKLIDRISL